MRGRLNRSRALMAAEIREQPQVWRRPPAAAAAPGGRTADATERIAARTPRFVLLVARGTGNHAALCAKYLTEITHQLPAAKSVLIMGHSTSRSACRRRVACCAP